MVVLKTRMPRVVVIKSQIDMYKEIILYLWVLDLFMLLAAKSILILVSITYHPNPMTPSYPKIMMLLFNLNLRFQQKKQPPLCHLVKKVLGVLTIVLLIITEVSSCQIENILLSKNCGMLEFPEKY